MTSDEKERTVEDPIVIKEHTLVISDNPGQDHYYMHHAQMLIGKYLKVI